MKMRMKRKKPKTNGSDGGGGNETLERRYASNTVEYSDVS
jgi:hypothetical protein